MALKIERVLGFFNSPAIQRKDAKDGSGNQRQRGSYSQAERDAEEELKKKAQNPQDVQAAIDELATDESFTSTGFKAELLPSSTGLTVRLTDKAGSVVKVLSSEEFLRLRGSSKDDDQARGKLLDQRF